MQMTKILFAAVIAGLGSASAIAADLPARMSTPAVTPANSWTGFYVGGNIGGRPAMEHGIRCLRQRISMSTQSTAL
jgi:hypothetical protein